MVALFAGAPEPRAQPPPPFPKEVTLLQELHFKSNALFPMYGGLFCFTHGRKTHQFHIKSFAGTILTRIRNYKVPSKNGCPRRLIASGAPDYSHIPTSFFDMSIYDMYCLHFQPVFERMKLKLYANIYPPLSPCLKYAPPPPPSPIRKI